MEPGRKSSRHAVVAARKASYAQGAEMVRATSIFPSVCPRLGRVVGYVAACYAGRVGPRSTFSTWQMMPPWRRLTCHIAPLIFASLVGIATVQLIGNRYQPRIVVKSEIVPFNVTP